MLGFPDLPKQEMDSFGDAISSLSDMDVWVWVGVRTGSLDRPLLREQSPNGKKCGDIICI